MIDRETGHMSMKVKVHYDNMVSDQSSFGFTVFCACQSRPSNYNRANYVAVWPSGNRLLKRLMSPAPKSQVMLASGDFFSRIFGIHAFYTTATLLNIYEYACHEHAADGGCGGAAARRPLLITTGTSTARVWTLNTSVYNNYTKAI